MIWLKGSDSGTNNNIIKMANPSVLLNLHFTTDLCLLKRDDDL
jgi:hypothetical protein